MLAIPRPGPDIGQKFYRGGLALNGRGGDIGPADLVRIATDDLEESVGRPWLLRIARASRTNALPDAYCSQQPRFPHSHQ